MVNNKKKLPEIHKGSASDIAFILLIFFVVASFTTYDKGEKGLQIVLPEKRVKDRIECWDIGDRNFFKVLLNGRNQLLVEDEPMDIKIFKNEIKKFINNNGYEAKSSDSPQDAIISLKSDRGTKYSIYIRVLDDIKQAYNELRAEKMGISLKEYLNFNPRMANKEMLAKYKKARNMYPLNISEAEPTKVEWL